jgi:hypothetical protein
MKKIISIILGGLFLLISCSTIASADYTVFDNKQNDVRAFFIFRGPIANKLFNHIDMISFSIWENAETPQFLYMNMSLGEVKYTERRSLYNIIWDFHGLMYFTGMHVLNGSDILDYSGFIDADGIEHKIWNTSVEIDEVKAVLTWTITKNDLGLKAGDVLGKPYAQSSFGTKEWETFKRFAIDKIAPGPNYIIQY